MSVVNDPPVTDVAIGALVPLFDEHMPRGTRLDAAMLRIMIAVPPDEPVMAARALSRLRKEFDLVRYEALRTATPTMKSCTHEQIVILYLQRATDNHIAVDTGKWPEPRTLDRRDLICDIGQSLFFQVGYWLELEGNRDRTPALARPTSKRE